MRYTSLATFILAFCMLPASHGAEPAADAPKYVDPFAFLENYRASHYLQSAAQIQKLGPAKRAAKLKEIAADPKRGSEAFVLCRMLFQPRGDAEFRRPMIGGPNFVDGGEIRDWPLEPITLYHDVPILVTTGYTLAGVAERPAQYVDYCLKECQWRQMKDAVPEKAQIKKVIDQFIAANPKLRDAADWLRQQAE